MHVFVPWANGHKMQPFAYIVINIDRRRKGKKTSNVN
jgi:hypothetical protein